MRKNKIKFILVILFSLIFFKNLTAEIIILSDCDSKKDGFLKNEYILDLNKSLMTRNYSLHLQGDGFGGEGGVLCHDKDPWKNNVI